MPKLETLETDGLRSELMLQQHLKALSLALRQQLQETEMRQKEELDRRIHQDSLLSTESSDQNKTKHQAKHVAMRRATSASALTSDEKTLQHPRPKVSSAPMSPKWINCSVKVSTLPPARTQQCERFDSTKTTQMSKEEEAETECQRKFRAHPVPGHVSQILYREMMELKEKERNRCHEQRRDFLLSIQRPFSFQEREKEKRERLTTVLNQVKHKKTPASIMKPPKKEVKDLSDCEVKDVELRKGVPAQTGVAHEKPTTSGCPKLRTSERTRREKLGFLDERPSFKPQIIQQVPDFSRLHKALQTEGLRKSQSKDVIKCQPFNLRTSALPARRSRTSAESSQVPEISKLNRSKSLGALTSLSADTLPTYITDATRQRSAAIRKSMEMRDGQNQAGADWLRRYQMRSQAMKKAVTLHARLLDPHSSLKAVFNDKLQHHREADQHRMREYTRELRDMKARVAERPFLFEQVKQVSDSVREDYVTLSSTCPSGITLTFTKRQKNAKAQAEQTYRNRLKIAGVKEQFVEEHGEAVEGSSSSFSSEEDTDKNHKAEDHIRSRGGNVDNGEKIEDVEEKSVKTKGEEMP
uniref:FAM161 centrosomal protein B n=1 Tax=Gasterosteus aculeatus aculeatus TaxID=481459 RepID=A0AAQ4QFQ4_GASAC|nr:protein FAM161B isoform X2 [Gasterosteus aculeatus aculeatus]